MVSLGSTSKVMVFPVKVLTKICILKKSFKRVLKCWWFFLIWFLLTIIQHFIRFRRQKKCFWFDKQNCINVSSIWRNEKNSPSPFSWNIILLRIQWCNNKKSLWWRARKNFDRLFSLNDIIIRIDDNVSQGKTTVSDYY